MNVLWESSKPLKPSAVLKKMAGDYAYTTIMTVLKRMSDKKFVSRHLVGNAYVYSPMKDKESFSRETLDDLFLRLFESYGSAVTDSYQHVSKKLGFRK